MQPLRLAVSVTGLVATFAVENIALRAQGSLQNPNHVALGLVSEAPGVNPPLAPENDKKFFETDYPHDMRPTVDAKKWTAPYPKLQSNKKYDSDYVKDENNDGGHWKAQMDYDTLKMKYAKQKEEVKKAKAKEAAEQKEAEDAAGEGEKAQAKATAAEAEAAAAKKEAEAAEKDLADASKAEKDSEAEAAEAKKAKKSDAVVAAEKRVEQAITNLAGCEKKLEDARKELEEVKAKEAADQEANANAKDQDVAKLKGVEAAKAGETKTKEESAAEAEHKAAEAEKEAASAKAEASKQEAEHAAAQEAYDKEKKELEQVKSDYEKAEDELRRLRGEPALPRSRQSGKDGENSKDAEKSGAVQHPQLMAVLVMCVFVMLYI